MSLTLTGYRLHPLRLPYRRAVTWAGHAEHGAEALLLTLETAGGATGVAEGVARINWTGHTVRSLACVLEEAFLPRLMGADLADAEAVARVLRRIPEHALAKAMIDTACCDLRAQAAAMPLWRHLGGTGAPVPVSWTLTRAAPGAMAREAEAARRDHGLAAFKVKTGQGLETDRAALAAIRAAAGADARLSADANRAYPLSDVPAYTALLAEFGVEAAEDPCELAPDASLAEVRAASRLPVLVDHACRTLAQARLFVGAGAEALSVKVPKSGLTESREIAALAAEAGCRVHIGIGSTGALGAHVAHALAATLPGGGWLPCEETFFLQLADDIAAPPALEGGAAALTQAESLSALVDWDRVGRLAI